MRRFRHVIVSAVVLVSIASAMPSFAVTYHSKVKEIQSALRKEGHQIAVDGKMGRQTRAALRDYQRANNLPETGKPDAKTLSKLNVK